MTTEVIYIGQTIKIKVKSDGNYNTNQYANNDNNNSNTNQQSTIKYHTVKSGDNLWALAQKYHTTVDNLKKWNKLYNGKTIYIGMKLIVKKA